MLKALKIRNFAIIKEALLSFEEGFNVLTGETGAGKSMVVDAISILLGAKPKTDDIRTGEEEAVLEGIFYGGRNASIKTVLSEAGIELGGEEIIVKRVIARSGKNRIFINNSMSSQGVLYELGRHLFDICAQNENRFLMNPVYHIDVLDNYASLEDKALALGKDFSELKEILDKKRSLIEKKDQALEKADFLRYIVKEIDELKLKEGEEEELKALRKKLSNLEKIKDLAGRSYDLMYSGEGSLTEKLKRVTKDLENLKVMDPLGTLPSLEGVGERIADASFELKGYMDNLDFDAGKLEEVEDRLDQIGKALRKYGSVEMAIERADRAREELKTLENFDGLLSEIEKEEKDLGKRLERQALGLSEERKKKAKLMDSEVVKELGLLSMEGSRFRTKISDLEGQGTKDCIKLDNMTVSAKGKDSVEFYLSTNVGEELKPLVNVASLGELSRIMLALKVVFYGKGSLMESFVFDEIDTGIGGKVAELVGRNLKRLSKGKQVLCVTHLSQIASYADHHFLITKKVSAGRTFFDVLRLKDAERKDEIARMIGGVEVTSKTKALAEELLRTSKEANS